MRVLTAQLRVDDVIEALKRRSGPHGKSSFEMSEDGSKIKRKGIKVLKKMKPDKVEEKPAESLLPQQDGDV